MDEQHPITPPDELVRQWIDNDDFPFVTGTNELLAITKDRLNSVITQAARWGADQELEACCAWVEREIGHGREWNAELRAAMRPKPPSFAEQAVQQLDDAVMRGDCIATTDAMPALRKALARLIELEALSDE